MDKNDLISRSELKEKVNAFYDKLFVGCISSALIAYAKGVDGIIDNSPTVPLPDFKEGYKQAIIDGKTNFSRPQGEWIYIQYDGNPKIGNWHCSECRQIAPVNTVGNSEKTNFCPNCGADMRKGGAENGKD